MEWAAEHWHLRGSLASSNDLDDPRLIGNGASFVGISRVSIRYRNVAARIRGITSWAHLNEEGMKLVARLWLDKVTHVLKEEFDKLTIELNIRNGQVFTQGDDFEVRIWVKRDGREPVDGATVELFIFNPAGQEAGRSPEMTTDIWDGEGWILPEANADGWMDPYAPSHRGWPAFFTVCSTVGTWTLIAQARKDEEFISHRIHFEITALVVPHTVVARNLLQIIRWYEGTSADPWHPKNGVDEPLISLLVYPRGPKVNLASKIDSRFEPYTNVALASNTLRFLNKIRFSNRRLIRIRMAGLDYGPVRGGRGLGHTSVGIYLNGQDWDTGYILESWWNQKKETLNAADWIKVFNFSHYTGTRGLWSGEYPTTGSGGGYFPSEGIGSNIFPGRTNVLTYSPVEILIIDTRGRRFGRLPSGTFLSEIPDAETVRVTRRDGTRVSMLSVPDGHYELRIAGTGDGTFHLVTGSDRDIVNYGGQPIRSGEQATLALRSEDLRQPLVLHDGRQIAALAGFPEQQSPPPPGGPPPDELLPIAGISEPAKTTGFAVQAGRRTLAQGGSVTVPVWLVNTDALANMNLNIYYDPAVVRPARNAARGNIIPQSLFEANVRDRGVVRIGFAQREDIRGTGTLAQIPFEAVGRAGTRSPLRVEVTMASAAGGNLVTPAQLILGEIEVVGADGRLPGDTTGRGTVTAVDAMNALKMSVGNLPVDMNADLDGDGRITSRDATLILQRVVGR